MRAAPLHWGAESYAAVVTSTDGWYPCALPCDVHVPLIEAGVIPEPLEADHCSASEWVEDRSWWFQKDFSYSKDTADDPSVELVLEGLDSEADVFLNGAHLGSHRSAFYPFRRDVTQVVRTGSNLLVVRVSSGLEHYSEEEISRFKQNVAVESLRNRGDPRRVFVRKPQYVYGWDWGPRLATCGIVGRARLEVHQGMAIRAVSVHTLEAAPGAMSSRLAFQVEVENLHPFVTLEASLRIHVSIEGEIALRVEQEILLRSGINILKGGGEIADPRLWWPNGMGGHPLYTVEVSCQSGSRTAAWPAFRIGIRTLRLALDPVDDGERRFQFEINGVPVLSKGGNWIPADSIYARVSAEKCDALIATAAEGNFNMLRIWGGGVYEQERFYEACDERGILVWHDFMFACALYPDDEEWFRREVEWELDYQTRRLANHPCMALWCGNNENHWGMDEWWVGEKRPEFLGGAYCSNILAPRVVERNCPWIPYWNSSPYGGAHPNGGDIGDRHHWYDCTMNPDMEKRITPEEYDRASGKFISEFGYIGPCRKISMERYFGGRSVERGSDVWKLHTNAFERDTVEAGIAKHYCDPRSLDLDGYCLYASLCQGLMLGYALEALRYRETCTGGLFWMYDDCWGEVGWTIVDYYLRPKPSYFFVKRALAPVKLIARRQGSVVCLKAINESPHAVPLQLEHGYVSFDGKTRDTQTTSVIVPPSTRRTLLESRLGGWDLNKGCWFARPVGNSHGVHPAVLRSTVFRELQLPAPILSTSAVNYSGAEARLTVKARTFCHAVHFEEGDDASPSDDYFDLLPGEERAILFRGLVSGLKGKCIAARAVTGDWSRDRQDAEWTQPANGE